MSVGDGHVLSFRRPRVVFLGRAFAHLAGRERALPIMIDDAAGIKFDNRIRVSGLLQISQWKQDRECAIAAPVKERIPAERGIPPTS